MGGHVLFFCLGFTCLLISSHQRSFLIVLWNSAHSAIPKKKKKKKRKEEKKKTKWTTKSPLDKDPNFQAHITNIAIPSTPRWNGGKDTSMQT